MSRNDDQGRKRIRPEDVKTAEDLGRLTQQTRRDREGCHPVDSMVWRADEQEQK